MLHVHFVPLNGHFPKLVTWWIGELLIGRLYDYIIFGEALPV